MSLVASSLAHVPPGSRTLYIGGGTPTILPADSLAQLVGAARNAFALPADAEVTVEANPGTVDIDALRQLRAAGINRLSLGVQSFDDAMLNTLARIHTAQSAHQACLDARQAGFDNLNLDLMFGLPTQTMQNWQDDVEHALNLRPQHLSLYALTIEEETPLARQVKTGQLPAPDDDLAADMYAWAEERLQQAGYNHYEISNWALPGLACQHNLVYWRNEPYLGLGAGAHSWWQGKRRANLRRPEDYIAAVDVGQSPVAEGEEIDHALEMGETMMMGLRLIEEGISSDRFAARFGISLQEVYAPAIAACIERGLLEWDGKVIHLSQQGHLLGNLVFAQFLPV